MKPVSKQRELAIAKRCQMLTGSYDGATRSCDCYFECRLSEDQQESLREHSDVKKAKKRNQKEFKGEL